MLCLQEQAFLAAGDSDIRQKHPIVQAFGRFKHTANPQVLSDLVMQMLHTDAAARPKMADVVRLLEDRFGRPTVVLTA